MIVFIPGSALHGHCLQVRDAASTALACGARGQWCHLAGAQP